MVTSYISPQSSPSYDGIYIFEKQIEIEKGGKAEVNIFASSRYILYINGHYVSEGPCRGYEKVRYYDTVETVLRNGFNHICVKVMHISRSFTSVYKTPKPMLAFRLMFNEDVLVSDDTWKCRFIKGHRFNLFGYSLPPYEIVNDEEVDIELPIERTDPCGFDCDGFYNHVGAAIPFVLKERPIPLICPSTDVKLTPVKSGNGFIELDAGQYVTAKLNFDIAANSAVKIIYSECYEFENGKNLRDDTSGKLNGYYDMVKTGTEDYAFEPFWFRAFRFIRIEGDCAAIKNIRAKRCHYPLEVKSSFECSNQNYNKMFEVSLNTMLCCSHEILVDCPYYEQQQYEMDASIEMLVLFRMTEDKRLVKKCLREFAESQQPDGLLCANYPADYVQIIPSYSCIWIMMLRSYLEETADTDFVAEFVGNIDKILQYFGKEFSKNGYITSTKYWDFIDWVPEWEYGAIPLEEGEAHTMYNLYYAIALKDAAYISERIGRLGLAEEYEKQYLEIRQVINKLCYNEEKGMYQDGSKTETYSMHTIIWSILSEVVPEDKKQTLIERLKDENIAQSSFVMLFYLFRALEKCNRYDLAYPMFERWQIMLDNHCTTWCENPDEPRSECHGWSSAPYYEFLSNILGVKTSFNQEIVIHPKINGLEYAKGIVVTRFGCIRVDWKIDNGKFSISIAGAEGILKKLVLPNGEIYEFKEEKTVQERIIK